MKNQKIIGLIVALSVLLTPLCSCQEQSAPEGSEELLGSEKRFMIPNSEMTIIDRNFKRDGGKILYPNSKDYEEYSTPFNGKCFDRPIAIFMPGSYENAQQAMIAFKTYGQKFTIVSGGHDYECVSTTSGILLSLAKLKKVTRDLEEGTVTVQAGARWQDVYPYVFGTGYQIIGGQCPTVGVGGFLLGTGFNWRLSPLYGSGAEAVVEMKAVLESGLLVTLTRDNEYKDLMWGMLGAGGMNFGLALEFKIKLHYYPQRTYQWMLMSDIFTDADDENPGLDKMVQTIVAWTRFFGERRSKDGYGGDTIFFAKYGTERSYFVAVGGTCKTCSWKKEIKGIMKKYPFKNTHYMDSVWSFGKYETYFPEGVKTTTGYVSNPGMFSLDLTDSMVEKMIKRTIEADLKLSRFEIISVEGLIRDPDNTSFAFPEAKWKLAAGINVGQPYELDWQKQQVSTWKEIIRSSTGDSFLGEYINYIDFNTEDYETAYFGKNLHRLKEIKAKYDPGNFFSRPFGIPPPE